MATFKLLHLSDLHFAAEGEYGNHFAESQWGELVLDWHNRFRPSSFCARIAANLPKNLADYSSDVDALLITGDIATSGTQSDLISAKEWVAGNASMKYIPRNWMLKTESPRLANVAKNLIIMPGNHDRYLPHKNIPRSPLFETVFGSCWDFDNGNNTPAKNTPDIRKSLIQNTDGQLIVICADFSLKQKEDQDRVFGYLGQGKAYQEICNELVFETQLSRMQYPEALVVWAVHFPPKFDHKKVGPKLRLLDEAVLLAAANRGNIRVIFSGHTHISKTYQVPGSKVVVVCAGTPIAFGKKEKLSLNSIILESNQDKLIEMYVERCDWDDDRAIFTFPENPENSHQFIFKN